MIISLDLISNFYLNELDFCKVSSNSLVKVKMSSVIMEVELINLCSKRTNKWHEKTFK